MNVYQLCDNEGWVLDTVLATSAAEAAKKIRENCEFHVVDRGPAGDRAWSKWMSDLPAEIGGAL